MTTYQEFFTFSWPLRGRGGGGQPKRSAWPLFSRFFFWLLPLVLNVRSIDPVDQWSTWALWSSFEIWEAVFKDWTLGSSVGQRWVLLVFVLSNSEQFWEVWSSAKQCWGSLSWAVHVSVRQSSIKCGPNIRSFVAKSIFSRFTSL